MKPEVGMYVRGNYNGIGKLIKHYKGEYEIAFNESRVIGRGKLEMKASHNIIELIEVGDYVNGYRVTKIGTELLDFKTVECLFSDSWTSTCFIYGNSNIKSVVTKEQFKAMEYEVQQCQENL